MRWRPVRRGHAGDARLCVQMQGDDDTRRIVRPWTAEDDAQLRVLVERYGAKKWSFIASHLGRTARQCRERCCCCCFGPLHALAGVVAASRLCAGGWFSYFSLRFPACCVRAVRCRTPNPRCTHAGGHTYDCVVPPRGCWCCLVRAPPCPPPAPPPQHTCHRSGVRRVAAAARTRACCSMLIKYFCVLCRCVRRGVGPFCTCTRLPAAVLRSWSGSCIAVCRVGR